MLLQQNIQMKKRNRSPKLKEQKFKEIIKIGKQKLLIEDVFEAEHPFSSQQARKISISGFNMQDIAQKVKMTRSNLYRYVESKRELWFAILQEYLEDYKGIVFDGTLPTSEGAKIKIKKIEKVNKIPVIYSVVPDDLLRAFVAFLNRDRKFQDIHFYRTHSGSRKTFLWIAENCKNIKIKIFESSYSKKQNMIFSELIFDNKKQELEYLKDIQMAEDEIIKFVNEKI